MGAEIKEGGHGIQADRGKLISFVKDPEHFGGVGICGSIAETQASLGRMSMQPAGFQTL